MDINVANDLAQLKQHVETAIAIVERMPVGAFGYDRDGEYRAANMIRNLAIAARHINRADDDGE